MKAPQSAFTLIELLVVVAIIAILAAILLPVLHRAQARSQMIYDLNNFKQLQLCWLMYVHDNNDYLPPNYVSGGNALTGSWVLGDAQTDYTTTNIQNGMLFQYNRQVKIYVCPANTYMINAPASLPLHPTAYKVPQVRTCSIEISLGGNEADNPNGPWTESYGGNPAFKTYQKISQIQATRIAQKIVFTDEAEATLDDGCFALYPLGDANNWWNMAGNRHNNGTVWSFADGHCEYWKWHGSVVNTLVYQTVYYQTSGQGNNVPGDSSDDLPRTEAGGAQYP
ncbi:MAG TPA: prepilin-type N-terminal cleavage/methylation domain-containing protein [Candidatus Sulfotelmatobacter sp.]|nr:prepilin-type N-terminal cleavage/methylation domain-containing protein [Candidatus Sulfotelmatobacter sp.]